jgi:predicted ATPase
MLARAVRNDWTLDDANAHAVAELCRRLDGLPLAIELAAAWVGALSPRAVLARLEQCLSLNLCLVPPDLPERHCTLEAAIGWSYDLLQPEERAPFDRLATFASGWSLEAAAVEEWHSHLVQALNAAPLPLERDPSRSQAASAR